MAIYRHSERLPQEARKGVVAIGNFDGLHLGHQVLLGEARTRAAALGVPSLVLTFEPHPRSIFQPDLPPFRLTPFRIKTRTLEALGIDHMVVAHFDTAFASISAEDFIQHILVEGMGVGHVVIGWDFCFGNKRQGNAALLRAKGAELGFGVTVVEPVRDGSTAIYSSSLIRQELQAGRPDFAARLLGRPFEIEGRVEKGKQLGRTLGFPTANVRLDDYLEPAHGIYAVRAGIDAGGATRFIDGVANLGRRPTVAGKDTLLEVHLFDWSGDLYGKHLRVQLISFLRAEENFDSLEAMTEQMHRDAALARARLGQGDA
ncbi:bifunctional riboflavin kinase/FAD synthetase [Limibacillus halophilus]|uniref:Riboflavin biosynthesis protein n=1 Tax=Limibacillus halophilus TaxID=1579333 RepID=A0A839SWY6_9PROT|nr:bifunctional riboflavin kinase/FAD synthetase [Limibacillus halophilus]MBB3066036.1 riboflavin kinase/FMN adenylyltransferase [Limibacillus halophilus]